MMPDFFRSDSDYFYLIGSIDTASAFSQHHAMLTKKTFNPGDLVIFETFGEISQKKRLVALYQSEKPEQIEPQTCLIGIDNSVEMDRRFAEAILQNLSAYLDQDIDTEIWALFALCLLYHQSDLIRIIPYLKPRGNIDHKSRRRHLSRTSVCRQAWRFTAVLATKQLNKHWKNKKGVHPW